MRMLPAHVERRMLSTRHSKDCGDTRMAEDKVGRYLHTGEYTFDTVSWSACRVVERPAGHHMLHMLQMSAQYAL